MVGVRTALWGAASKILIFWKYRVNKIVSRFWNVNIKSNINPIEILLLSKARTKFVILFDIVIPFFEWFYRLNVYPHQLYTLTEASHWSYSVFVLAILLSIVAISEGIKSFSSLVVWSLPLIKLGVSPEEVIRRGSGKLTSYAIFPEKNSSRGCPYQLNWLSCYSCSKMYLQPAQTNSACAATIFIRLDTL